MANKPIFGYWQPRGVGHPIRHMLHYLNVDYVEKTYGIDGKDDWVDEKFQLGLQFPNLPYWIDKDSGVKLTESLAILKHIARTYGSGALLPQTNEEKRDSDLIESLYTDIHWELIRLCYHYSDGSAKQLEENIKLKFEYLNKFLEGKSWVLGSKISYVDFPLYEAIFQYNVYKSSLVEPHPNLDAYMKRFEAEPAIEKYMGSPGYWKLPCFSAEAEKKI